uniref:Uncharacterized protein n=1 Tax=Craspedostauros australis TaxID=1486917 RepID=A0A7R9ZMH9_9STRA
MDAIIQLNNRGVHSLNSGKRDLARTHLSKSMLMIHRRWQERCQTEHQIHEHRSDRNAQDQRQDQQLSHLQQSEQQQSEQQQSEQPMEQPMEQDQHIKGSPPNSGQSPPSSQPASPTLPSLARVAATMPSPSTLSSSSTSSSSGSPPVPPPSLSLPLLPSQPPRLTNYSGKVIRSFVSGQYTFRYVGMCQHAAKHVKHSHLDEQPARRKDARQCQLLSHRTGISKHGFIFRHPIEIIPDSASQECASDASDTDRVNDLTVSYVVLYNLALTYHLLMEDEQSRRSRSSHASSSLPPVAVSSSSSTTANPSVATTATTAATHKPKSKAPLQALPRHVKHNMARLLQRSKRFYEMAFQTFRCEDIPLSIEMVLPILNNLIQINTLLRQDEAVKNCRESLLRTMLFITSQAKTGAATRPAAAGVGSGGGDTSRFESEGFVHSISDLILKHSGAASAA